MQNFIADFSRFCIVHFYTQLAVDGKRVGFCWLPTYVYLICGFSLIIVILITMQAAIWLQKYPTLNYAYWVQVDRLGLDGTIIPCYKSKFNVLNRLFTIFSKLHRGFGWVSGYLIFWSHSTLFSVYNLFKWVFLGLPEHTNLNR